MLCYSFLRGEPGKKLLYIASFAPPTGHLFSVLRVRECRDLDGQLKVVSLCTFAMSALFFVGEILGFRLDGDFTVLYVRIWASKRCLICEAFACANRPKPKVARKF